MDEEQARIRGYLVAQGAKLTPAALVEKVQQAMADLKAAAAAVPRGALRRAARARGVERQRGDGPRAGGRSLLRRQHRERARWRAAASAHRTGAGSSRTRPRARPRRGVACSRSSAALCSRRSSAADPAARPDAAYRAPDVRPAHLAGDPALHPAARPRSRRPAPEDRDGSRGVAPRLMRVSISLRLAQTDWAEASSYVTEAERLGVDDVWSAEAWGHDGVTPLAFMAARTSRIRLGTGILQAGTRTPALLAMTAMSMQSMSNGRFLLGLGVSGPQVIEGWHGIRFDRPVQRMRETVEIVRRGDPGRAPRVQGQGLRAAAARRRGQGPPLRRAAPAEPADLPGHALAEEPRDDGRDRRRLARHLVHARARARLLRLAGRRRGARGPLARRSSTCRRAASSPSATTWSG